ncbi:transglycosylase SLT domain-containing protein [Acetobacter sp. TBRC 12305]|uniref:Transglycosylase SLT domain-containing protein n=1 Tax=Acetobacter garciniae TaxID=2817435 RepID=A0A939HP56_9PROT|nr:transglycosylase SLT domain-containing protein [Acetobacter garciniae]MBO1324631.1 transglycosylase SLT domain-containing protein [Acetobacter garciniae]MBX0344320.1 transglycosylase SLT domain-containing protein [Acetobacter garciniae]
MSSCFLPRWPVALALPAFLAATVPQALAHSPDAELCIAATAQAERAMHIPDGFLAAMSRVESGRPEGGGVISPWPWTVTADGVGHYYGSRREALDAVELFHLQGIYSLDVGCMQVNLQQHPNAFSSLDQAFDPTRNALYAADFLLQMHNKMGSWPRAAAAYHSQTPGIGTPYQWKVLEAWAVPQDGRPTLPDPRAKGPPGMIPQHPAPPNAMASAMPPGTTAGMTPTMAQHFARPAAPRAPDGQNPVMVAQAPTGNPGTPAVAPRLFHPFTGVRHYAEPASRRPVMEGTHGRTLASYRATPVQRPFIPPVRQDED